MSTEGAKIRWESMIKQPYMPAPTADPGMRIAHALEYIAAQLSEINAKMTVAVTEQK